MKINEARNKYLFTVRINLPQENEEDAVDFLVFREPTVEEIYLLKGREATEENIKVMNTLFPKCLINHSFVNDDGTKTTNVEVSNFLKESCTLYLAILSQWFESVPFQSRLEKQQK
jgi:hypothetical protein